MSFIATSLTVSQPLQRSLAVALLAAVVAIVGLDVVLPIVEHYRALRAEVVENKAALRRFDAAAARLPQLEAEQASLGKALAAQDGYLKATNDSLVAAEMQQLIKTIADRAGAELKSTQILAPREDEGFRRVTARVDLVGSTNAIERVWYDMESGAPFLFVDTFNIEAQQERTRDRSAPPRIALDVRFEASGFARAAAQ